jgi:hypothetical protein
MAMGKQQGSGGMNRDDIIRLAREADCLDPQHYGSAWADKLERFAALVAAAEREKVAAWIIAHFYATGHGDTTEDMLEELESGAGAQGVRRHSRSIRKL